MTDARATAAFLEVARAGENPPATVSFVGLEVASLNQLPAAHVDVTTLLTDVLTPAVDVGNVGVRASQLAAEVLSATDSSTFVTQLAAEVLLRSEFDPCVHGPVRGCTTAPVAYRLRIRNADDTDDQLVVTSLNTGADAVIAEVPNIDGATFDPLSGKTTVGGATVLVIDAADGAPDGPIDETDRIVTKHLADDDGRSQLLGRKAYLEWSGTCGDDAEFEPHFAGYVTSLSLVDAITWEIGLAHTSRDDQRSKVWTESADTQLTAVGWVLGGPILYDVPSPAFMKSEFEGYWYAEVIAVYDTFIHVDIDEDTCDAFPPIDVAPIVVDRGWPRLNGDGLERNVFRWAQGNCQKYFVRGFPTPAAKLEWEDPMTTGMGSIRGYCPRLLVHIEEINTVPTAHTAPLMASYERIDGVRPVLQDALMWEDLGNHCYINWANTDPVAQPAPGDILTFFARAIDISPASPGWILAHPVTIVRDMLFARGYAVDSSSVTDCITDVGDISVAYRVTDPPTRAEAIAQLCGMFGFGITYGAQGEWVFFCWRVRHDPVVTIGLDDLAGRAPSWWKTSESSRLFSVAWKFARFDTWPGVDQDTSANDRAVDGISQFDENPIVFQTGSTQPAESRTQQYQAPCMVLNDDGTPIASLVDFVAPHAAILLDAFGDGAITMELDVLPTIAARIGEEVLVDLSPVPGFDDTETPVAQRGLPNSALVIGDTPQPFGRRLTLLRLPNVEDA